jgi:formamidopyrimidine-DNA glycosylase
MPELPEVETVRRGLEPVMAGARFRSVTTRRPDLRFPLPPQFVERLHGAMVERLDRRGKYLTAPLSTGETLIMHLGMTGRFSIRQDGDANRPGDFHRAQEVDPAHSHVEFVMDGDGRAASIEYNDPRRFGFMDLAETARLEESKHFSGMGPEPMSDAFTPATLFNALRRRSAPLKAALLDQSVVAGLGNIYVCEALFSAGLSPRRKASTLSAPRAERLHAAIRRILAEAIDAGGSTLRDFAASDGSLGYFQHRFNVYDREGDICVSCGVPVRRIVQSGRSTFYCRKCQK